MLKAIINDVCVAFLEEARHSPQLLEDMAAMEKYLAESYGERVYIELLQNADDAQAKRTKLFSKNGSLFFANDGRPFSEEDLSAISRSGSSKKRRGESIGYRGVGFKSSSSLTNQIVIYSSDTYFTFSKAICAGKLGISDLQRVPTIRVPFVLETVEREVRDTVDSLVAEGFTTVFVFMDANIQPMMNELKEVNPGYFIFLNNLVSSDICVEDFNVDFHILRESNGFDRVITISGRGKEHWYIRTDKNIQYAFKLNDNHEVVECSKEESVFHCYLPTLESTGLPFKINGDFSTDPSRKHLMMDDRSFGLLNELASSLFTLVSHLINGNEKYLQIETLSLLNRRNSFSKVANLLHDKLNNLLSASQWVQTKSGKPTEPTNYIKSPSWLEPAEFEIVKANSDYLSSQCLPVGEGSSVREAYLQSLSTRSINESDVVTVLGESSFRSRVNHRIVGKLTGHIIRNAKIKGAIHNDDIQVAPLKAIQKELNAVDCSAVADLVEGISEQASASDVEWFSNKYSIDFSGLLERETESQLITPKTIELSVSPSPRLSVTKWRAAEQQCVELETYLGNTAKDVSKQNLGYDVESYTPSGEVRYIEVKHQSRSSQEFTMTNNEYTAAHQYGSKYYVCVIQQDDSKFCATYIRDPLANLKLEKRVKQWEWFCESFGGEQYTLTFV